MQSVKASTVCASNSWIIYIFFKSLISLWTNDGVKKEVGGKNANFNWYTARVTVRNETSQDGGFKSFFFFFCGQASSDDACLS